MMVFFLVFFGGFFGRFLIFIVLVRDNGNWCGMG